MAEYDDEILEHYANVAEREGKSPSSTMADKLIRKHETEAVSEFVEIVRENGAERIGDYGCGNGYTLEVLADEYPGSEYVGIEYTDELRELAEDRLQDHDDVEIRPGDVREPNFWGDEKFDAIVSQRLLINLLDAEDQQMALDRIVESVRDGGWLLFIEAFIEPLDDLNEARAEFGLDAIDSAHHNRYLRDGIFEHDQLEDFGEPQWNYPPNFLSSHYFISRAFDPGVTKDQPMKRNSKIQRFFSKALPPSIGDFAPVKFFAFQKSS